jgi:hypothetical protein
MKKYTFIKYIFRFFAPFRARLALKFAKRVDMTQKIFFPNIFYMGIKERRILC